jgi:chorismate mutase
MEYYTRNRKYKKEYGKDGAYIMDKRLYGIRGAVCTENNASSITENVCALCSALFSQNGIAAGDIVSIQFTVTDDIDALNPAAALRKENAGIDVSECALFCSSEPRMKNSLARVVRVLVTAYMNEGSLPHHVYLNGAEVLRPDFAYGKK